jgi:hypothetical protein
MSMEAWLAVRARVLADSALQAELWALEPAVFRARLTQLGAPAEGNWPWDPGPLMISLGPAAPPLPTIPTGPGWIPAGLDLLSCQPMVVWRQTGGQQPRTPLHPGDARIWSTRPLNRFLDVRTPPSALDAEVAGPAPAGFIFHMSRCGSTLASRMLNEIEGVISLSEPAIVGDLLRARRFLPALDPARLTTWLRSAVALLGAGHDKIVVKTEGGGLFGLDLLRRAFPTTPWVFLHRDPLDVMLSQQRERSSEMMPQVIEAIIHDPAQDDLDLHCATTLAAMCQQAATALKAGDGALVAYEDLPGAVTARIAPLFGLHPTPADLVRVRAVASRHARRGETEFVDEQQARRAKADPRLVDLADRLARPSWERLRGEG